MTLIKREQILDFLNIKVKSYDEDPHKRWITTWNNYLNGTLVKNRVKTNCLSNSGHGVLN